MVDPSEFEESLLHTPQFMSELMKQNTSFSPALMRLVEQKYTTTKDIDLSLRQATLMAMGSEYFTYIMQTQCFIPEIILKGEKEDWNSLASLPKNLIQALELNELLESDEAVLGFTKLWLERLDWVLGNIALTFNADAQPNRDFWASIYKYGSSQNYDHNHISGWSVYFYPMLAMRNKSYQYKWEENSYIRAVEPHNILPAAFSGDKKEEKAGRGKHIGHTSISTDGLPNGVVKVNFKLVDTIHQKSYDALLTAGMFGVKLTTKGTYAVAKGVKVEANATGEGPLPFNK